MSFLDIFKIKKFKSEIEQLKNENENLKAIKYDLDQLKYKDLKTEIADLLNEKDYVIQSLTEEKAIKEMEIQEIDSNIKNLNKEITFLNESIVDLKEIELEQSFGFYEPKYGFRDSSTYKIHLDDVRAKQKKLVKQKNATSHSLDWVIEDDRKRGKEFILDTIKLTLRAFNNECDNIISKVKYNTIDRAEKRINKIYIELNSLTDMQNVSITYEYLNLKLEELYLKYEFECKLQEEKEEQQEIKERMKEEAKAAKEIEKAKEKIVKEEKHFEQAINNIHSKLEKASDKEKEKLLAKLQELEMALQNTKKNKEDIINREQNTRAGYVYVISNIGSFGEDVYKIGMTRRLEPLDRVRELSNASVPFNFDVHAMIFSDDAPTLENTLHKEFEHYSVNKINNRKEFFKVPLTKIESLVKEKHNATIEFTKIAAAEDYRKTLVIEKSINIKNTTKIA
ncbi:DUF4041 domain-containing protein [Clostridium senegalense]